MESWKNIGLPIKISLIEVEGDNLITDNLRALGKDLDKHPKEALGTAWEYCLDERIYNAHRFFEIVDYFNRQNKDLTPLPVNTNDSNPQKP